MRPTNPLWNPPADPNNTEVSDDLVFPFQPKHAAHINDIAVWRMADDFHTMLIGLAVMRDRAPLDGSILFATQRLLNRVEAIRDEMIVMRDAEGASVSTLANDLDMARSTAQGRIAAARKGHGEHRVWITGRAVDDLPTPPEDIAYLVRGSVDLDGIAYAPAQLSEDAVIRVGKGNLLLYGKGDALMVAARGAVALADADTIELRASDGHAARFAVADAERVKLPDSNPSESESEPEEARAPREYWENVGRVKPKVTRAPGFKAVNDDTGQYFEVRGAVLLYTLHGRKEFTADTRTVVVNGESETLRPNKIYSIGNYQIGTYEDGIHGFENRND